MGFSVCMTQRHYVQQLKTIDVSSLNLANLEQPLDAVMLAKFLSLLGAAAWLCQTRIDTPVYIQALQRAAHAATTGHIIKLNKIVKLMKRKDCCLTFHPLKGMCRTLAICDAAFRREDPSALAMRGCLIGVSEERKFTCRNTTHS